jgi:hypothetical protein
MQKRYVFLIISYVFSSTKLEKRAEQILLGSREIGVGEVGEQEAQTMYMRVSKCKNNKIKGERKKEAGKETEIILAIVF